jgi:hypothetical protein
MTRRLKVFRTPIGFHDAYVAAASQREALAAWGSDANLFAHGMAEVVTEPSLVEAPLARPGEVIKVPRGSAKEHLAALPKEPVGEAWTKRSSPSSGSLRHTETTEPHARPERRPKPEPRPSRDKLAAAERAITDTEEEHRTVLDDLRRREEALRDERQQVEKRQNAEMARLERAAERAAAAYRAAVKKWRG